MNLNKNVWKYGQTTTDEEHNTITWAQNTGKNPPPQARGTTIEIWSIIFFKKGRNMGTIAVRSFFRSQLSISWKKIKLSYIVVDLRQTWQLQFQSQRWSSSWKATQNCSPSTWGEVYFAKWSSHHHYKYSQETRKGVQKYIYETACSNMLLVQRKDIGCDLLLIT